MRLAATLVAAALLAAGCGDDEEDEPERQPVAPAPAAPQDPTATEQPGETAPEETETEPSESPEDQPGGAGDEEPIRSEAVFTGRDGRITPRRVEVPAYIAVLVRLVAEDNGSYSVEFDGRRITPGETIDFAGLRPNERVTGTGSDGRRLVISGTAEPGP